MKSTSSTTCVIVLTIATSHLATLNSAAASNGLRTVAITGQAAPGVEVGATFTSFAQIDAAPVINNRGEVAFTRHLAGTGGFANDSGIWSEGGGNGLRLVTREASPAPGTNVTFSDFYGRQLVIDEQGHTAFFHQFNLSQPGLNSSNDTGIWSEAGGSGLALVAREGNAAPGTTTNFSDIFNTNPRLNDNGQIAFRAHLSGTGSPIGVWRSDGAGSSLALVALRGHPAPGTTPGTNFSSVHNPVISNNGKTAFRASLPLSGPGVNLNNDDGIWSEGVGGGLALVAREGDPAPGVGPDVRFAGFSPNGPLAINSHGQTAFIGSLTGPGVDITNQGGIWREGASGLKLVARAGDPAPGTAPGTALSFQYFTESLALNDNGHIAFWANFTGAELGFGIWSDADGTGITLVGRTGGQAPGAAPGITFNFFGDTSIEFNNRGQTAFWAALAGPGIDSTNDNGIWAQDASGVLRLVVREGDLLDVSDDPLQPDLRTVSAISRLAQNTGNSDGRASSFNDLGQLTFIARFTDGTEGVFVSNLVAVPEPNLVLFVVAVSLTWRFGRQRELRGRGLLPWATWRHEPSCAAVPLVDHAKAG